MRFSAGWFKKLFFFANKREKTSLTDEAGSSREKVVAEAEEVIEKASLRKRLMGLFRRGKNGLPDESESAGQDDTQAEPEAIVNSGIDVAAPIDNAGSDGGEVEALPRPGVFARLIGIFRLRKKVGEVVEAGEKDAGHVAENKNDQQPGTEEAPKKSLWARLSAVFKRKSGEQSAADLADAGELFSWGEGEAAAPVAGKVAQIEKGKKDERGESKTTDKKDSIEEGEESPPPGFGRRVSALIREKKVWIPLLLVIIGTAVFAVSLTFYQLRTREHARMLALEKKNKQLQEENKKLQPLKNQTVAKPSKAPATASRNNQASGGPGTSSGQDATDDCTVKDKASAAEVLKRCIDSFNATDRH